MWPNFWSRIVYFLAGMISFVFLIVVKHIIKEKPETYKMFNTYESDCLIIPRNSSESDVNNLYVGPLLHCLENEFAFRVMMIRILNETTTITTVEELFSVSA